MRVGLIIFVVAAALLPKTVAAEDEAAVYGPARQEVLDTPNLRIDTKQPARFSVHVLPWRDAPDTTLDSQLQRILDTPPPGEAFDVKVPPKLISVAKDFAMSLTVDLKAEQPRSRTAVLFACTYKGKKKHYREVVVYGDMISFIAVGKKPVMNIIHGRVKKLCKENPATAKRAAMRRLVTTAPGEGDGAARLKHMVFALKQGLNGYGTFQVKYSTYALFEDGSVIRRPAAPLPDFNVEASRRYQPKRWGKWRDLKGGQFEISWPREDGTEKWRRIPGTYRAIKPAQAGMRYNGRYEYWASHGSLFNGGSSTNGVYVFRDDGTYTTSSATMSQSADIMGSTVNRVRTEGPDGCKATTAIVGGLISSKNTSDPSCGDSKSGRYEIDEWVITLHANNGVTSRFTFFPTGEDSFYLHGRDWGKARK